MLFDGVQEHPEAPPLTGDSPLGTCVHESSHAIMATLYGVKSTTTVNGDFTDGLCASPQIFYGPEWRSIMFSLSGCLGTAIMTGESIAELRKHSGSADWTRAALKLCEYDESSRLMVWRNGWRLSASLLWKHRQAITTCSEILMANKILHWEEVLVAISLNKPDYSTIPRWIRSAPPLPKLN